MSGISTSKQELLKHGQLLELLSYDSLSGDFTALVDRGLRVKAGDIVGGVSHSHGYRQIRINYVNYLAHRLAWFYAHGEWPEGEIDHIDGNTDNNRLSNLRVVSRQQNRWNAPARARKGGILRNISFEYSLPRVTFSKGNQRIYHRAFPTMCAAIKERNRIAHELYGDFARAN